MRQLRILCVLVASWSLCVPIPTNATWAQINHATSDTTLRDLTEAGSNAFMDGSRKLEDALRALDLG